MLIRKFSQLSKNDIAIAGGKGANLGEMTRAGISVPPGFVILAGAFERFLAETDLNLEVEAILKGVNVQDINLVEKASCKIRDLIADAKFSEDIGEEIKKEFKKLSVKFVAVRSSATVEDSSIASWAGELESYLNVDEAGLPEAVKKCWSSLFTPRAIFYRFEKNLHEQPVAVAVVVQAMVQSEVAGIVFTVHPVTEDKNQMVIEAGWGLGEAIVGGKITPDTYVINKSALRPALRRRLRQGEQAQGIIAEAIMDKNISSQAMMIVRRGSGVEEVEVKKDRQEKQKLADEKIIELAKICAKIEQHYNFPQDIEWAFESGKFYITQSRPITTLDGGRVSGKGMMPALNEVPGSYSFHARNTDVPFIFTDIAFRPENYGQLDYVVLQTGDQVAWYLSPKGQRQADELGARLLDEKYAKQKLKELRNLLSSLELGSLQSELKKISPKDLFSRWVIIEGVLDKFANLYFFCEQPAQESLDRAIVEACPSEKDLIKVLHDPAYAANLHFSEKQKKLLYRAREFGNLKFKIHNALSSLFENLLKFMQDFAERYDLLLDQTLCLRSDEIKKILSKKMLPDKGILNERKKGLVFLPQRGKNGGLLVGEKYLFWKNLLEPKGVTEIKGVVAFHGKARGFVKIHLSAIEKSEIPPGTVLISGMTNPQIVPFLKNAVAIVTDEGGLTCHAAIISRELKIPCIVGAKIATQVFKDGDLVEVDANEGVVRILKKHKK